MGIVFIVMRIGMIFAGFNVFNLFKSLFESEKEEKQFVKLGFTFKIFGILILLFGILETARYLYF